MRLKKTEENLQLVQQAQQNADLASSQRADLEAQLKQAQDKLQQTQQNADLVASQRAALEARLKKGRGKRATSRPSKCPAFLGSGKEDRIFHQTNWIRTDFAAGRGARARTRHFHSALIQSGQSMSPASEGGKEN
jgi:hypothetical protein